MPLEIYAIVVLAFMFFGAYIIGRHWNYRIQKNIWKDFSEEIKPYCRSVSFKGLGPSGFKVGCRIRKKSPLRKLEISAILLDREFLLHYLFSKYKKQYDRIIVKSNFEDSPNFSLEVVPKGTKMSKKALEYLTQFSEVKLRRISENFLVKTSKPSQVRKLFSDKSFLSKFLQLNTHIKRLSISKKEPHLLLVCTMGENVLHLLLNLILQCGQSVSAIMEK
ncbi:MAG: hypothetical protein ACE5HG_00340 [Candidatus Bathyarchaeia archaeon]